MSAKYTSNAKWEDQQVTSDKHSSASEAISVCRLLQLHGYGGESKKFPISTWIEETLPDGTINRVNI